MTIIMTLFYWSLLSKGTGEQYINAKGTGEMTIIMTQFYWSLLRLCIVLWSLLLKGTGKTES